MVEILVPIFVCVILPVSIVLIVSLVNMNRENKRAQIIMKAIETNNAIDANMLAESLKKPQKSAREICNQRLLRGCIYSLTGLVAIAFGLFGEGMVLSVFGFSVTTMLGCILLAIGVSYLIVYRVSYKHLDNQTAAK